MLRFDCARLREFPLEVGRSGAGVTVVEGPSGAGKTTLLRLIAGLDRPDAAASRSTEDALRRRAFVPPTGATRILFQEYALFPHLDVAANVGYGLRAA